MKSQNFNTKSSVHISLPSELLEKLNRHSDNIGKNRNTIIVDLLNEYLEDWQDYLDIQAAIKQTGGKEDAFLTAEEFAKAVEDFDDTHPKTCS